MQMHADWLGLCKCKFKQPDRSGATIKIPFHKVNASGNEEVISLLHHPGCCSFAFSFANKKNLCMFVPSKLTLQKQEQSSKRTPIWLQSINSTT